MTAGGLAWAFHYRPGAAPAAVERLGRAGGQGWVWAHFDLVDAEAGRTILACPDLSDFAKETLTGLDEQQRLLAEQDTVAGVLPGFARRSAGAEEAGMELVPWRFAVQPGILVTARRVPVRSMAAAWRAARDGHAPETPLALIGEAIVSFAQDMRRSVAALARQLDAVEDVLLAAGEGQAPDGQTLGTLPPAIGRVRRDATRLRRALDPVMRLMDDDVEDLPGWAADWDHDAAHRASHAVMDDLRAVQERARALQDELTARQAEETNRRLYIVSVVTTLILPATFVTGFFGMNTGGMFLADTPLGTALGGVLCLTSLGGTWLMLRWRRLL